MHKILILPVLSSYLVFGLEWQALISGRALQAARRFARQQGANHIVLDGETPASFGYGHISTRSGSGVQHMYSAAQNVARLYPSGSMAAIVALGEQAYWLVAVHEGAVIARSDVVYGSHVEAQAALLELQTSHSRLQLPNVDQAALSLAAIASASIPSTQLRRLARWRLRFLWGSLVLLCMLIVLTFTNQVGVQTVPVAGPASLQDDEVLAQWQQAVFRVEQNIAIHGVAATHGLLQHLYDIPVNMAGWVLSRVRCQAQVSLWHCNASYERKSPQANNDDLLTAVPPAWKLDFPSFDRASAIWVHRSLILPAAQQRINFASENTRYLQSAWQGIRPAFSKMVLGPRLAVEFDAPKDNVNKPLPQPAALRRYIRRQVDIEGPLRSMSLLLAHTHAIAWTSITLIHSEVANYALASSRLRVQFQGELYELHDADDIQADAAHDKK